MSSIEIVLFQIRVASLKEKNEYTHYFFKSAAFLKKVHDDFMKYISLNNGVRQSSFDKRNNIQMENNTIILR